MKPTTRPNARLIAAAPEMLSMLKRLIGTFHDEDRRGACQAAQAMIDRIEGKEHDHER